MCLLLSFRHSTACDCVDLLPTGMLCGMQVTVFTSPSRTFEGREVQYQFSNPTVSRILVENLALARTVCALHVRLKIPNFTYPPTKVGGPT